MVRGKYPSRACSQCKRRKIKCDEQYPQCGQCVNKNLDCAGYKSGFDLVFRDQTGSLKVNYATPDCETIPSMPDSRADIHLRQVATDLAVQRRPKNLSESSSSKSEVVKRWKFVDCSTPVPRPVHNSIEATAVSFFFTTFISVSSFAVCRSPCEWRGYLEYLAPLHAQTAATSSLHQVTGAVSMISLSNHLQSEDVKREAFRQYGRALSKTSCDIKNPEKVKSNETLISVMLLALFESMSGSSHSLTAYSRHINGAVALLSLRGGKQLDDSMSKDLYWAARNQIISNSIIESRPVPSLPFHPQADKEEYQKPQAAALSTLSIQVPPLRAKANCVLSGEKSWAKSQSALSLRVQAELVTAEFEDWLKSLDFEWQEYNLDLTDEMHKALGTSDLARPQLRFKTYKSHLVATTLNRYRTDRIYLEAIIMRCTEWLAPPDSQFMLDLSYQHSKANIQILVDDICASVPYHLGLHLEIPILHRLSVDLPMQDAAGAYIIVWPLFIGSSLQCIPEQQRQWLRKQLLRIAKDYGFAKARLLAEATASVLGDPHLEFIEGLALIQGSRSGGPTPLLR